MLPQSFLDIASRMIDDVEEEIRKYEILKQDEKIASLKGKLAFLKSSKDRPLAYAIDHASTEELSFLINHYFSTLDNKIFDLNNRYNLFLSIANKDMLNRVSVRFIYEIFGAPNLSTIDRLYQIAEVFDKMSKSDKYDIDGIIEIFKTEFGIDFSVLIKESKNGWTSLRLIQYHIKQGNFENSNNLYNGNNNYEKIVCEFYRMFEKLSKDSKYDEEFLSNIFGEDAYEFYNCFLNADKTLFKTEKVSHWNIDNMGILPYDNTILECIREETSMIEDYKLRLLKEKSYVEEIYKGINSPEMLSPTELNRAKIRLVAYIAALYEGDTSIYPEYIDTKRNGNSISSKATYIGDDSIHHSNISDEEQKILYVIAQKCSDFSTLSNAIQELTFTLKKRDSATSNLKKIEQYGELEAELSDIQEILQTSDYSDGNIYCVYASFVYHIAKEKGLNYPFNDPMIADDYVEKKIMNNLHHYDKYKDEIWKMIEDSGLVEIYNEFEREQSKSNNLITGGVHQKRKKELEKKIKMIMASVVQESGAKFDQRGVDLIRQIPYIECTPDRNLIMTINRNFTEIRNNYKYHICKNEVAELQKRVEELIAQAVSSLSQYNISKDEILLIAGLNGDFTEELFNYFCSSRYAYDQELDGEIEREYRSLTDRTISPTSENGDLEDVQNKKR